jgi:predicted MFS family arabinose efflux permease
VSYRDVFAFPHARGLLAASIPPRLAYGLAGLPLLVALRDSTGSYAAAGAATSVYALGVALLGPARARLVQRRPGLFLPLGCGYAVFLVVLAATCAIRLPAAPAIALAAVAGLCPPPVGPRMRAQWSRLAPDDALRQRALSLDTAVESTSFALGPALAGTLIAATSAPVVLGLCAAMALAGFTLLAAAFRASVPSARAATGTPADAGTGTGTPATRGPRAPGEEGAGTGRERVSFGIKGLLLVSGTVAVASAVCDIAVVAAWGPLTAGMLTALFPVGGVLGGLTYGRRQWRGRLACRPYILTAASAACYALPVLAYAPAAAGAAFLAAGACCDILAITTYQLVSAHVAEESQAEAGAWLNTAFNLGMAIGAAGGGVLTGQAGPRTSFAVAAALCFGSILCLVVVSSCAAASGTARAATLRGPIHRRG